jgi:ABC-type lipoprotein export system ATPase subunit
VTLSGGEAQRVAVCAAVAHEPALILADEPTGELDRAAADAVYTLLSEIAVASGAALVLVSHDIEAMRVADRVVRIRDGRLSEEWSPSSPSSESLVVDDRGWVRLPEPLRASTGIAARVHATESSGAIVLTPVSPPLVETRADAPVVPQAEPGDEVATMTGVTVDRAGRRVLDGQRLVLRTGTLTVVRGRSGSGKTTLLRILAGLDRTDSGTVRVRDTPDHPPVDLAGLDRTGLAGLRRRRMAVSAQSAALIDTLDVLGNLELVRQVRGLPDDPTLVDGWLDALGLSALRHRPVRILSGGERQRVSVARVLAAEPEIAVLDEPTSQQDEANAERLVGVLVTAARRGTAVVTATHDPVLVAAADEILTLV